MGYHRLVGILQFIGKERRIDYSIPVFKVRDEFVNNPISNLLIYTRHYHCLHKCSSIKSCYRLIVFYPTAYDTLSILAGLSSSPKSEST